MDINEMALKAQYDEFKTIIVNYLKHDDLYYADMYMQMLKEIRRNLILYRRQKSKEEVCGNVVKLYPAE